MRDLMNNINLKPVIVPPAAAITDNTAQVGAIIDRQGYESLTYAIMTGTLADADATFTVLLEESNDSGMSGATAVADADLIGTEDLAGFTFAADSACRKLSYKGNMRYTRLTITPANNTGNAPLVAMAILGDPLTAPTANPPA
jgi:hypothetical protein